MKRKKLNNGGFTLVELLVVIVILIAIVSLAIPSITSSMERSKDKINAGKVEVLGSAGELYLSSKNRNKLNTYYAGECYLKLSTLKDADYISDDDMKDADGNDIGKEVYRFVDTSDPSKNEYRVVTSSGKPPCIP